jgi:hypothetical protein
LRAWIVGLLGKRTTTIGRIDAQSSSRRRRFALFAGLGAADDLTDSRDENWLTGTGTAIPGIEADRRPADTVALACAFRISAEGFVAEFAADLVGAVTVFFAADRVGASVCFRAWADLTLVEVFAVGLCPCLSEPTFFSGAGVTALALALTA